MNKKHFTQYHVDLIKKWHGKKSDKNNVEQLEDYPELKEAYEIVKEWANSVKETAFPEGKVKLRKSPVNQGGHFSSYLWAKIYPSQDSPEQLAYTIHISTDEFAVKIDTVNAPGTLVEKYESVRGNYYQSPIVKCLSHEEALAMTLEQLVRWSVDAISSFGLTYDQVSEKIGISAGTKESSDNTQVNSVDAYKPISLNQILYGPPGTGKTYHTIEAAVKAAEPERYQEICATAVDETERRIELRDTYNDLCRQKRIRFVTFHQSYGYEEFVEGLSASTDDEQLKYSVKPGVFKRICEEAKFSDTDSLNQLDNAIEQLKLDAEGQLIPLKTSRGKPFSFTYHGHSTFRIYPEQTKHQDLGNGYPASIEHLRSLYVTGDESDIYNRSYVKAILAYLKTHYQIAEFEPENAAMQAKNHVLIIDEINRGNISKIFGELITLIEPSKRKGADEAIELVLPYSGDKFSVPDNLYIIGTMNTADRSLAMMDTALRRRFDFIEMMPNPSLLRGEGVKGINLEILLETLNKRIEILYDREHTLGHAFFMPVKNLMDEGEEDLAFEQLVSVFQNKVIPLLQEYFFEDWHKIRLVLGDNQREAGLQFIQVKEQKSDDLDALFGEKHELSPYGETIKQYSLKGFNEDVWQDAKAYRGMYFNPQKETKRADDTEEAKAGSQ